MNKTLENEKFIEKKINLNDLYTKQELEDIKKIIPKIRPLIISNICKYNDSSNKSPSKKGTSEENKSEQYIEKNKFIQLILEKIKLIFKKENNIAFSKSISFILEEIQKILNESETKKNGQKKITKNSCSLNVEENRKTFTKKPLKYRRSPDKNSFLININSKNILFPSQSNKNFKSNVFIPLSPKNKINNINNNTNYEKYNNNCINFSLGDEYKDKNIKGNSIINNFITFSNSGHIRENSAYYNFNSNNIRNDLSNVNNHFLLNKNKLNSFYTISNKTLSNTSNMNINKQKTSKFNKIKLSNIKFIKRQLSPQNLFSKSKFIKTEKNLIHIKDKLSDDLHHNSPKANSNYLTNYIKKIKKIIDEKNNKNRQNNSKNNNTKNIKQNKKIKNAHPPNVNKTYIQRKNNIDKKVINIDLSYYSKIEDKNFNIFEFDEKVGKENTLSLIGNYLFNKYNFVSIIKYDKFINWCKKVTAGYSRKNTYHNDLHGADVTQTSFIYLNYGNISTRVNFNKVSICSIILSCLCHDIKHPGVNNNFLKETKDELALRYNDISILENMHISETFKIINQNQDCNIFSGVNSNVYKEMRKQMISCILSTDMTFHSKHIEFMKNMIDKTSNLINNNNNNLDDKQNYMDLIVHSSDISNPTKPFNIYLTWAKLVLEEFFQQGDKEKALGLPCSCDRKKVKLNLNQISFIDCVVESLYSSFTILFPDLKYIYDNIIINRTKFLNYKEDSKTKSEFIKNSNKKNISKEK